MTGVWVGWGLAGQALEFYPQQSRLAPPTLVLPSPPGPASCTGQQVPVQGGPGKPLHNAAGGVGHR